MIIVTPLFVHSPHSDSTMAQYRRPAVYVSRILQAEPKTCWYFWHPAPTSDFQIFVRIMVNILYVYLEIRIQKDLCPIMNCRCNLNTFLRCYVRKVVIKNDNIKLHSACGRLHNGSESYLTEHSIALSISTWFLKYLVWKI